MRTRLSSSYELKYKHDRYRWYEDDLREPFDVIKIVLVSCCLLWLFYQYALHLAAQHQLHTCVVEDAELSETSPGHITVLATGHATSPNGSGIVKFADHANCPSDEKPWLCSMECEPFDCWVYEGSVVWHADNRPKAVLVCLAILLVYLACMVAFACSIKFKRRAIRDALHGTPYDVSKNKFGWD